MMNPVDIIIKKRNKQELTTEEIYAFIQGITGGFFKDYQVSAMLMAIFLNGMTNRETLDLTMAMAYSGDVLNLERARGIKVDKHSTGGVGDTTTLVLAPLVACCGATVAKMSGHGLGHTGGTLDKLESIPGVSVTMEPERFIDQLNRIGIGVIGQSLNLTPADKVMYALRDVTGTVDSMPLIISSILSKKIASGANAVVLDVKSGSGALMPTLEKSIALAKKMVEIGSLTNHKFIAVVTDMDQPLGLQIGNALEVEEAIRILSGELDGDLKDVSIELGAYMLFGAGLMPTVDDAKGALLEKLESGAGLEKLGDMIQAQGGDRKVVHDTSLLPVAPEKIAVAARESGFIQSMQTDAIGNAAKALGAGRERKEDAIDPAVGIIMKKRIGDRVQAGDTLYELHVSKNSKLESAGEFMDGAIVIADSKPDKTPLIYEVIMP